MKCPLIFNGALIVHDKGHQTDISCLKEECAWWIEYVGPDDSSHANCALVHIADRLFGIVAKMPSAAQFTK